MVPNWTGCLSSHRLHRRFRPYHRMRVLPPKMMITRMADIARIAARLKTSRMRSGGAPNSLRTMIEAADKMANLISRILRGGGAFLCARPSAASITSDWSLPSSALRPHFASSFQCRGAVCEPRRLAVFQSGRFGTELETFPFLFLPYGPFPSEVSISCSRPVRIRNDTKGYLRKNR